MNTSSSQSLAVIILAAGKGTRMKSDLPKVLHPVAGQPMLWHVLQAAQALNPARTVVITGHGADTVEAMVTGRFPGTTFVRQTEQRGTGHAVQQAQAALSGFTGHVVILYGDVMLNARPDVLPTLHAAMVPGTLSLLTADVANPTGFGRVFQRNGQWVNVEEKDCTEAERAVTTANPGIYALPAAALWPLLAQLQPNNKQGEYYLTDIIALAPAHGLAVTAVPVAAQRPEMGVNDRLELAAMEAHMQTDLRTRHMRNGVTLTDPASTFFSTDTMLGTDVTVGPGVTFGPAVTVESHVTIHPYCHLAGCTIRTGAEVGPFARIRPTTDIGPDVHIGNFVEVKNSTLGQGTKAGHLSYVGDADIGAAVNLGAGTLVANYHRKKRVKNRTTVGNNASTGAATVLVAPLTLGTGATTGAGTVVREDMADGELRVATPPQKSKPGYNL